MLVGTYRDRNDMEVVASRTFKTPEFAERRSRKQTAELNIRKRKAENDGDFVVDWDDGDQMKYSFYYNHRDKIIGIGHY